jgi:hypothetical protein
MDATRRALLGAAALGASGLALMQNAAQAEATDRGNPGEGGFARNAVQLPPGAKVAEHDPKDIEAMPNFKYSLDGGIPKITSGGWAKESTIHQLPVSKGDCGRPHVPQSGRIARIALARHSSRMGVPYRRPMPNSGGRTFRCERNQQLRAWRSLVFLQGPRSFDPMYRRQALPLHTVVRQRGIL